MTKTPATPLLIGPLARSPHPTTEQDIALLAEARRRFGRHYHVRYNAQPAFCWGCIEIKARARNTILGSQWHFKGYADDLMREWGIR